MQYVPSLADFKRDDTAACAPFFGTAIPTLVTNLLDTPVTGQAIPSLAPREATPYFRKTECFCFTPQKFEANQTRELVVRFYIDPSLPTNIDRVTLGYAMFDVPPTQVASVN